MRPHHVWQLEKIAEAVILDDRTTSRTGISSCYFDPCSHPAPHWAAGPVILFSADYGSVILDQESTERAYLHNE